ncbi:MoxR-like ATPase [Povalibacter uvarum]|uniref:MoxR-like ATPase n=1 Tax=Povalibacter uvarum TaxID=732238 RepID=A0A841HFV8_9GAMM|nr:MoxR family ATPase [Povalibacter uvarum]MBB6091329.1 MoxR-like ATPase [Povalibacter uvarum]
MSDSTIKGDFPFIGIDAVPPGEPLDLPAPDIERQDDPAGYLLDQPLVDAINVALLLGRPLLLMGDAGTGKTQLGHRLAWQLGFGKALIFNTKSTSAARDLFYAFDTLRRFHAAQTGEGSTNNLDYLTYNALGEAILQSHPRSAVANVLPEGFEHIGPRRSVVLIDEIDKAPRDFPNDLLHEVDNMSFRIPELRNVEVKAARNMRPVLVLTSNSEKNLPDAFLRRCVFYNIPLPEGDRLVRIVRQRVGAFADGTCPLLESALSFFKTVRSRLLRKTPATAELINWLHALTAAGARSDQTLKEAAPALKASISTLAKTREDADELALLVKEFLGEKTAAN